MLKPCRTSPFVQMLRDFPALLWYNICNELLEVNCVALLDKLELRTARVISIVGSGGKTTLLYGLAREFARLGKRVAVTTTTHIFRPSDSDLPVFTNGMPPLSPGCIAVVGTPAGEKLACPPTPLLDQLARSADVLLIEADGSRRLPAKFPRSGEPVLIPQTDQVLLVAGLSALGRPVHEVCHRWEFAQETLGLDGNSLLSPEWLARLLIQGYGKITPHPQVILNQADTLSDPKLGDEVCQLLLPHFSHISILSLHQEVISPC